MKNWWVSWYDHDSLGEFEYHGPWWVSGYVGDDTNTQTICAAVKAETEEAAKETIAKCYDVPRGMDWRFCEERPDDWTPFCSRFPKAEWMKFYA